MERKTTYGDNDLYGHAFFHVTGGETYLVSGGSSSNILEFPLGAFYSKSGEKLMSFGEKPSGIYENEPVLAPFDAVTLVVNQNNGASLAVYQAIYDENQNSHKYDLTLADEMIRLQKLNPFCFKPFPEGYVTFVFDDLTDDIDSVAATFEEYGYPLVLAAIPDRLEAGATALTDRRGSYSPGMIMKDIMETVVRLGGEIMVHNRAPVVTEKNQRDYDFMYDYFIQAKDLLTEAGFSPRGIIRAGGDGALQRSEEIERWLIGNYDYSNMGLAGNYCLDRKSINRPINEVKNDIKYANDNKAWIRFMCHGYAFGEGKTFRNESDLREILDYCRSIGVEVVTYAYMIDQYKSTELSEWQ